NWTIGPVVDLTNQKGEGVVYLKAGNQALTDLHYALRKELTAIGAKFTFPAYKAHVTLGYNDSPITAAQRKQLDDLAARIDVTASDENVQITRKVDNGWEDLE